MNRMSAVAAAMALAISLPSPLSAQDSQAGAAVEANSGDAAFTVPPGWTVQRRPKVAAVVAPEGDLRFWVVETGAAAGAAEAVEAAYRLVQPGFARKLRLATDEPAAHGWDEIRNFDYEVAPDERIYVFAAALRRGDAWTVILADAGQATYNKRTGQINSFFESLKAVGYVPESFAGRKANRLDQARRGELKAFIAEAMKALRIPGVGYAFIDDGKIVEEGGLGVRTLGGPQPVTAHTRFMVASNTKGMTTLLLAKLVDQGKLRWDEPVVEAFPEFRLGAPEVTRAIQIRHLVCACTGMPHQDLEWHFTGRPDTPPARVFDMLETMKPTSGFGEVYQYSNLLAASAGYVAARVAYPKMELGAGYDRAMREAIFEPLGMRETTFSKAAAVRGDHASPHSDDLAGRVATTDLRMNDDIYFIRPAGGAWSSAHDMALYALDELREGKLPDGGALVSAKNLLERRFRGVAYGEGVTYGMGLENIENAGVRMIHHGGSLTGYKTDWFVIPETGVGAVILTNSDNGRQLVNTFGRRLLEVLYDGKAEALADMLSRAKGIDAWEAKQRGELTLPPDPEAVARLASHYTNAGLGTIDVRRDGAGLVFDFGGFSSHVATRRNPDGSTSFVATDPGIVGWELLARPAGARNALVARDAQHEYLYAPAEPAKR